MTTDNPSVLIVEDEPDLARLHAAWLADDCAVETAHDGTSALDALDETVDIVLLDRQIPDRSSDAILDAIRDRSLECRVALVTAVDPDFDVLALGVDDYLVKPVSKDELVDSIESPCLRATYDEQLRELFALASKRMLLDEQPTGPERQAGHANAALEDRLAAHRVQTTETLCELLETDDHRQVCRDLTRDSVSFQL